MDKKKIEKAVKMILEAIGEDPKRKGLIGTPRRVAEMHEEIFSGIKTDPEKQLEVFLDKEHHEIVLLKDIPLYSICVCRRMCVYTKEGIKYAERIKNGDELLTFDNEKKNLVYTKVEKVYKRKTNEIYEIEIDKDIKIKVTEEHPLYIKNKGWVKAKDITIGDEVLAVQHRRGVKRRRSLSIKKDYNLGYFLGALASDGSIWRNQIRMEVNDRKFAEKFASSIKKSFGLRAKVKEIYKPSGFLKRIIRQYQVRVICGELVRIVKNIFEGEKKTKTFCLPKVILEDKDIFKGFLHGYLDGDGSIYRDKKGKFKYARILSSNRPFLEDLAKALHTKLGTERHGTYEINVPTQWLYDLKRKDFYKPFVPSKETFRLNHYEFKIVKNIKKRRATKKNYIVYNFSCTPHNTFIINGIWVHNCEHHLIPFIGKAHVAYIPKGRVTGLSKLARVVDILAKRPQVQEKLTTEIADILMRRLKPLGVLIVIEAEHLCMSMRGIKKPGILTVTSAVRGIFKENQKTRAEALSLINK